jgi:hypothetical protein|tara:strand:+ start:2582 stop:2824 length:243 start_codon:yes stop_codon:yes gene_type:complete
MKKKNLLQEWKQVQENYYNYFDVDELQKLYIEWFDDYETPIMSKDEMIEELIESELDFRRDDSVEDLKETIGHIKSLSVI